MRGPTVAAAVGGVAALLVAGGIGFLLGRSGREVIVARPSPRVTLSPPATATEGPAAAIPSRGAILRPSDIVTPGLASAPCVTLIPGGLQGNCGEVTVSGTRVVWILERRPLPSGTTGYTIRILTFDPERNGWATRLQAADPTGQRFSRVTVVTADLTGDSTPELAIGYREVVGNDVLQLDIVGYGQAGSPLVLAHPRPAPRGSAVILGAETVEYAALYPGGEPECCPPSYEQRTIEFRDGFFRVVELATVAPAQVPPSQL